MNASQIVDVLSGSFFALLGIWAAVGERHWFLRMAVVAMLLLGSLLVPAHQVAIEFGLAIAFITVGVWVAHGRKSWQKRFSMQTIMLAMVVVAVIFAVLGSAPDYSSRNWIFIVSVGGIVASIALICLWIVYGKSLRWWLRGIIGSIVFALLSYWMYDNPLPVALSVSTIIISVLLLARGTHWFGSPPSDAPGHVNWQTISYRIGFITVVLAVSMPLHYILYRLLTPDPIPVVEVPEPNGYHDLVAIGNMLPNSIRLASSNALNLAIPKLEAERNKLTEVIQQVDDCLTKTCTVPNPFPPFGDKYNSDSVSLIKTYSAILVDLVYCERTGKTSDHVQACLRLIKFEQEANRGRGRNHAVIDNGAGISHLRNSLGKLSSSEYREVVQSLLEIDSSREPQSVCIERRRIIAQHRGWQSHLRQLQSELSGEDAHQYNWESYKLANFRLLLSELAVHAYVSNTGKLPATLEDLLPEHLPEIPGDPFGDGPIKYLVEDGGYKLYSNGWDGDDDNGQPPKKPNQVDGDLVLPGTAKPL